MANSQFIQSLDNAILGMIKHLQSGLSSNATAYYGKPLSLSACLAHTPGACQAFTRMIFMMVSCSGPALRVGPHLLPLSLPALL